MTVKGCYNSYYENPRSALVTCFPFLQCRSSFFKTQKADLLEDKGQKIYIFSAVRYMSCRRQGMLTQGPAPDPKSKV